MHLQKYVTSLASTARLVLFACFTALSAAQAQSSAPEIPIEIMLSHQVGCKLFHPGSSYDTQADPSVFARGALGG